MAITPIGNRYKGFIFAGENSRNYGVYITTPAVFNAPERDAELLTIPGRNGDFVRDLGRWRNIEVTYNCALPAESESDFISGVEDFRNMLASKIGYQRLTDEINASEYREGAFVAGLDVDSLNVEAGTFSVRFTCKPQRFLTSGETAVTISNSGDTITNPTGYDARPLLEAVGYGNIGINDDAVSIANEEVGNLLLYASGAPSGVRFYLDQAKVALLTAGDTITIPAGLSIFVQTTSKNYPTLKFTGRTVTPSTADWHVEYASPNGTSNIVAYRVISDVPITFSYGTSGSKNLQGTVAIPYDNNGTSGTYTGTLTTGVSYDGDRYITIKYSSMMSPAFAYTGTEVVTGSSSTNDITAYSTTSVISDTIYIDLDIGEAYVTNNGDVSGVNNIVTLPAILPELAPGSNVITFDGTISSMKIIPRWWQL